MKLNVPTFNQRDPQWKDKQLGTSPYTLGSDGCASAVMAMLARYYGKDTDPARFNDLTRQFSGFHLGSLYIWGSITRFYADITNTQVKDYPFDPAPLKDIDAQLAAGKPVPVWVDMFPRQAGNQMHWILLVGKEGDDYWINDPWTGDQVRFRSRYGDPTLQILGHRFYDGPVPQSGGDALAVCMTDRQKFWKERDEARAALAEEKKLTKALTEQLKTMTAERDRFVGFRNQIEQLVNDFTR